MNISPANYKTNGFTGLANLGNTCFLNSCLQVLSHTYEIHGLFDKPAVQTKMAINSLDVRIFNEWKQLVQLMWSGNGAVKPIRFVSAVHEIAQKKDVDVFTGFAQNDVSEFLRFILSILPLKMISSLSSLTSLTFLLHNLKPRALSSKKLSMN